MVYHEMLQWICPFYIQTLVAKWWIYSFVMINYIIVNCSLEIFILYVRLYLNGKFGEFQTELQRSLSHTLSFTIPDHMKLCHTTGWLTSGFRFAYHVFPVFVLTMALIISCPHPFGSKPLPNWYWLISEIIFTSSQDKVTFGMLPS